MSSKSNSSLKNKVLKALESVKDPEIPALSVIDLGIIIDVEADEEGKVIVHMTPTFTGCPALQIIQGMVKKQTASVEGVKEAKVNVDYDTQWTSNRVTENGRKALKEFGLAPPPRYENELDVSTIEDVECPFCDSSDTILRSPFGSTLCRAIHYCNGCQQSFEQFKPL